MVMVDNHHHTIMTVNIFGIIYELIHIFDRPLCTVIYYLERVFEVIEIWGLGPVCWRELDQVHLNM